MSQETVLKYLQEHAGWHRRYMIAKELRRDRISKGDGSLGYNLRSLIRWGEIEYRQVEAGIFEYRFKEART